MSNLTDMCIIAFDLASKSSHKFVLSFKVLTCCLGFIGNIWIIKTAGNRWLAHPNARVIYTLHLFWATFVTVSYGAPFIFDLYRFSAIHTDPCDYTASAVVSFWIRFVPAYAINAQSYAMLALALERSAATIFLTRYERIQSPIFGIIMGVLSMILPLVQLYTLIIAPSKLNGTVAATSILTPDNQSQYQIHLVILQTIEISTLVLFLLNFTANKIQARKVKVFCTRRNNLNTRYQINETRKVLSALVPCFLIHFAIFFIPPGGLWLRSQATPPLAGAGSLQWIEVLSEYQIYSLLMPLVIYILRRKDRARIVVNDHKNADHYFDRLNSTLR